MAETFVLFRARVPRKRRKNAEIALSRLGLKPGDAFNSVTCASPDISDTRRA